MELTIKAETIEELMEKVCALATHFCVDLSENTKTPVTAEVVEAAKTVEAEVEERLEKIDNYIAEQTEKKKEKEKKTKAKKEDVVAETKTYTKADIVAACQKLSETKGLEVARETLATYGAKRVSEVKEEDYAEFIKACEVSL